MKYAAVIALLLAIASSGCSEPEQAESPEESASEIAAAAEAQRLADQAAANQDEPKHVRAPGFFGGGSSHGRRKVDPDDLEDDNDPIVAPSEPAEPSEPVKRPPPKLVAPGAEAERQIRLARLYIANASDASSDAQRELLNGKAATILKKIISKHPKTPSATEAKKLLAEIETTQ